MTLWTPRADTIIPSVPSLPLNKYIYVYVEEDKDRTRDREQKKSGSRWIQSPKGLSERFSAACRSPKGYSFDRLDR